MHLLDILTVLLTTLMGGNELAVSLFINPALWKLDDRPVIRELAASLGKFMPFWYGACLLLLLAEVFTHWARVGSPSPDRLCLHLDLDHRLYPGRARANE